MTFFDSLRIELERGSGGSGSRSWSVTAKISEMARGLPMFLFSQFLDSLLKLLKQGLAYCVLNVLPHPQNIEHGAFLSMKCEGYWVKQDVTTGKYFLRLKLYHTFCLTLTVQKNKTVSDSRLRETNL